MKTCIIYYSLEGNTKLAAETLARKMDADVINLVPKKAYPTGKISKFLWGGRSAVMSETPELEPMSFDEKNYDRFILCTPIWASTMAPPLRTFIETYKLEGKQYAVITCCSGGKCDKCYNTISELLPKASCIGTLRLIDPAKESFDKLEASLDSFIESLK